MRQLFDILTVVWYGGLDVLGNLENALIRIAQNHYHTHDSYAGNLA